MSRLGGQSSRNSRRISSVSPSRSPKTIGGPLRCRLRLEKRMACQKGKIIAIVRALDMLVRAQRSSREDLRGSFHHRDFVTAEAANTSKRGTPIVPVDQGEEPWVWKGYHEVYEELFGESVSADTLPDAPCD